MTDIASLAQQQALSPLHVRAYFDEELFAREQETIFSNPPSTSATRKACPSPATGAACHTRKAAACWCATLAASS